MAQIPIVEHSISFDAIQKEFTELYATTAGTVTSFGAKGDGVANDTAAIQAAINATPANGTLLIPPGTYRLIGSGTSILTMTKAIRFIGIGLPLLLIDATVPTTRNIITIAPTTATYAWEIANFICQGNGGSFGKHVLNFDLTSGTGAVYASYFHDLIINPTAAGSSLFVSNVGGAGGLYNSVFERNFCESIQMLNVGDNIEIAKCTINSTVNTAIVVYQITGAGNCKIVGNALASTGGAIIFEAGISPIIRDNEIETPPGTNTLGALVVINTAGGATEGCQLVNNQIQVLTGTGNPVPVKVNSAAANTLIMGGRISVISGAHVAVGAGATATHVDEWSIETVTNNVIGAFTLTDGGTATLIR